MGVGNHAAGTQLDGACIQSLVDGFAAELGDLFGVVVEMEAQVLLHPQHVADHRRALFLEVIPVQPPDQRGDGEQEQHEGDPRHGPVPARRTGLCWPRGVCRR